MPLVSVCIPVYRAQDYIEGCLTSLCAQTIASQTEVVLVSDASPDRSREIAEETLRSKGDVLACWRVFELKENQGPTACRQQALAHARGRYVTFMDADDSCDPSYLASLTSCAQAQDAQIILGVNKALGGQRDGEVLDADAPTDHRTLMEKLMRGTYPGWLHGRLFERTLLDAHPEAWNAELRMVEDLHTMMHLVPYAQRIARADDAVYLYNLSNERSISRALDVSKQQQVILSRNEMEALLQDLRAPQGRSCLTPQDADYLLREVLPYAHALAKLWLLSACDPWNPELVSLYNDERLSALPDLPFATRAFLRLCEWSMGPVVHAGVFAVNHLMGARRGQAALG